MEGIKSFDSALYAVPARIRRVLEFLPDNIKAAAQEIRLRTGLPVALTIEGESVFVNNNSTVSFALTSKLLAAEREDIEESFRLLCNNSAYAHTNELKNGYIMMRDGHRAGICGRISETGIRDVSSVNIRVAREVFGAANEIAAQYESGGLLIAGPPGSGKTTILRDLVRQLSSGNLGRCFRICLIDSRGELSASFEGNSGNFLGENTDILMMPDKALGIEIAVRTMYPDIVAFDEIGKLSELERVSESFSAGVRIITTAHIGDEEDLGSREVTARLLRSGAISRVAVLPRLRGGKIRFIDPKEMNYGSFY